MGACFEYMELKGTKNEVFEKFEKVQTNDRYENGHCYSGGFGMAAGLKFKDRVAEVNSSESAEDWLDDNASKGGPALAVQLYITEDGETVWGIGAWCAL